MGSLWQDLKIGWRSLWRTPGFACLVILIMGLGIGATTMIFNITHSLLFRARPYMDFQRNVQVFGVNPRHDEREVEFSYLDFADLRKRTKLFDRLVAYNETQAYLTLGREPERFEATRATAGLFAAFGAQPILGREFVQAEEEKATSYTVIMISERVWRERFQSDPNVIGRTLKMNGRVRRIVGVAPPEFRFPEKADFFIPVLHEPNDGRGVRWLKVTGRLAPGVTRTQANAEIATFAADLARQFPADHEGLGMRVADYRESAASDIGPMLAIMMSAVGFVLLIVCANVANLLLARGAGRHREIALRFALGATRGRVVRQLLTESLILGALGGAFGLLLAVWGRDLVLSSIPIEMPYWMRFDTDLTVLGFTVAIALGAAVIAGLAPALTTSQVDVNEALKEGTPSGGRGRVRLRSALVVAEISLALVLLAGAGLMIRSFMHEMSQRRAIQADGLVTGTFTMPIAVYPDNAAKLAFMDRVMPAIASLPGVRSLSAVQVLPLGNNSWSLNVWLEGDPTGRDAPVRPLFWSVVRPAYFSTIGLPLRAGRDFDAHDDSSHAHVAIISETGARTLWPGRDPLRQRFKWSADDTTGWVTVVGVVADVAQQAKDKRPQAQVYTPHMQQPMQTMTVVARHDGDPAAFVAAMRRVVQSQDPDMPLYETQTMDEVIRLGTWEERIWMTLMTVFATLALVIAGVGIYGVMAYSVAQRTQEIGIRMALGAARRDIIRLVVGQATRLIVLGVGIGLAGGYAVTRLMASVLVGVSPGDPPTFVGVTVILAASSLLAAWLPAERATRVDPMVALRTQ